MAFSAFNFIVQLCITSVSLTHFKQGFMVGLLILKLVAY